MTNKTLLIAPCGMNCAICSGFLREKKKCPGCRGENKEKPVYCRKCKIKNCSVFDGGKAKFCHQCKDFPCKRVRDLDKRYRTKYGMSMIENLENIKKSGIKKFLLSEKARWTCKKCGATVCVHKDHCLSCGAKVAKKKYKPQ